MFGKITVVPIAATWPISYSMSPLTPSQVPPRQFMIFKNVGYRTKSRQGRHDHFGNDCGICFKRLQVVSNDYTFESTHSRYNIIGKQIFHISTENFENPIIFF